MSKPVETYSLMHFDGHAVSMVITGVTKLTIPERLIQEVKGLTPTATHRIKTTCSIPPSALTVYSLC